jgi:hypothetical protein
MDETFNVIDCNAQRAWTLRDWGIAVRYAAARHAATGHVVEVVENSTGSSDRYLVLPPDAPMVG